MIEEYEITVSVYAGYGITGYNRYAVGDIRITGPEEAMRELDFNREPITSVRILRNGNPIIAKVFKCEDTNHIMAVLTKAAVKIVV